MLVLCDKKGYMLSINNEWICEVDTKITYQTKVKIFDSIEDILEVISKDEIKTTSKYKTILSKIGVSNLNIKLFNLTTCEFEVLP